MKINLIRRNNKSKDTQISHQIQSSNYCVKLWLVHNKLSVSGRPCENGITQIISWQLRMMWNLVWIEKWKVLTTCESKSLVWEQLELCAYQVLPHKPLFLALFFPTKGSNLSSSFFLPKSLVVSFTAFKPHEAKVFCIEKL